MIYRVLAMGELWKVAVPDGQPTSFHASKSEALARALALASRDPEGSVEVLRRDGSLEASYDARGEPLRKTG